MRNPKVVYKSLRIIQPQNIVDSLSVIAFSDWRTQPIKWIYDHIDSIQEKPDLIIYCGDDIQRFENFEELASKSRFGLLGVIGNDDTRDAKSFLRGKRVYDLHDSPVILGEYGFIGLEGSTVPPGYVIYNEGYVRKHLEKQYSLLLRNGVDKFIIVSHTPPYGLLDYSLRFGCGNIGSKALIKFIKNRKIDLVLCGHSHLNGGKDETFGSTTVLNVSSHDDFDSPGNVAGIIVYEGGVDFCFQTINPLIIDTPLLTLQQVGFNRARQMIKQGIKDLDDITEENRALLKQLPGVYDWHVNRWIQQVKAIKRGKPIVLFHPIFSIILGSNLICYDIETNLECDKIWLIGAYDFKSEKFYQFFEKDDEKKLLIRFEKFLRKHEISSSTKGRIRGIQDFIPKEYTLISYSNCRFEQRVILDATLIHNADYVSSRIEKEIDLGIALPNILIGDFGRYNLKDLGTQLGFKWRHPDIDGMMVGMAYSQYLRRGVEPHWRKLLEYNEDDVMAIRHIILKIRELYGTAR